MNTSSASARIQQGRQRIPHAQEYFDLLRYEVDPIGGYRVCRNQQLPHLTINEWGYRGRSLIGSESILLLGDSVTFGVGASGDESRFPRFLERASHQLVADASVRAYRSVQHYAQLPKLLSRLPHLKLVIVWMGYADLLFWVLTHRSVEGTFAFETRYGTLASTMGVSPWLLRVLRLGQYVGLNVVREPLEKGKRANEVGTLDDLVTHIALYVGAMRDLCAARGIALQVWVQPFIRTRPIDVTLQALADASNENAVARCGIGWYEACERFLAALQSILVDRDGIRCVDCQPFVSEEDFLDQVHLKEEALDQLAGRLVEGGYLETGSVTRMTSGASSSSHPPVSYG